MYPPVWYIWDYYIQHKFCVTQVARKEKKRKEKKKTDFRKPNCNTGVQPLTKLWSKPPMPNTGHHLGLFHPTNNEIAHDNMRINFFVFYQLSISREYLFASLQNRILYRKIPDGVFWYNCIQFYTRMDSL